MLVYSFLANISERTQQNDGFKKKKKKNKKNKQYDGDMVWCSTATHRYSTPSITHISVADPQIPFRGGGGGGHEMRLNA